MNIIKLNLKKTFFYQYYGQFVFKPSPAAEDKQTNSPILDKYIENGVLELRHFSSITKEEGAKIANKLGLAHPQYEDQSVGLMVYNDDTYTLIINPHGEQIQMLKHGKPFSEDYRKAWDYLREIGIAFQWRDYSVKEQQEEGWIQFPPRGYFVTDQIIKGTF